MRTASRWIVALVAAIPALQAQTDQSASSAQPVRAYTLLGEDEDWSFLKDPSLRQAVWDPLKYIPLGSSGWYLSIGGGAREVLEQVGNDNWGNRHTRSPHLFLGCRCDEAVVAPASGRLWSLFCRRISQTGFARQEHQLFGVLGGVQILTTPAESNSHDIE